MTIPENATTQAPRKKRVRKGTWAIVGKADRYVTLDIPVSEEMEAFLKYMNDDGGYFGIADVMKALFNTEFCDVYYRTDERLRARDGQGIIEFLKECGYLRKDWTDPHIELRAARRRK